MIILFNTPKFSAEYSFASGYTVGKLLLFNNTNICENLKKSFDENVSAVIIKYLYFSFIF